MCDIGCENVFSQVSVDKRAAGRASGRDIFAPWVMAEAD